MRSSGDSARARSSVLRTSRTGSSVGRDDEVGVLRRTGEVVEVDGWTSDGAVELVFSQGLLEGAETARSHLGPRGLQRLATRRYILPVILTGRHDPHDGRLAADVARARRSQATASRAASARTRLRSPGRSESTSAGAASSPASPTPTCTSRPGRSPSGKSASKAALSLDEALGRVRDAAARADAASPDG